MTSKKKRNGRGKEKNWKGYKNGYCDTIQPHLMHDALNEWKGDIPHQVDLTMYGQFSVRDYLAQQPQSEFVLIYQI